MNRVARSLAAAALLLLGAAAWSQDSPSDKAAPGQTPTAEIDAATSSEISDLAGPSDQEEAGAAAVEDSRPEAAPPRQDMIASLTIFVLAIFVGFEVITKVPPTLHTPLMSGSNAISGITLVGAILVASGMDFPSFVGLLAVILATINAVGGFLVTHRMLSMFQKK